MDEIRRVQLSEIAELITKGTTPTTLGYEFQEEGVNFLKIECFDENGGFIESKAAHISVECNEKLKRSQLKAGDILFSIAGAIGRVAIVTEEMLPANTNQALAIIRISNEQVYLPYIKLILTSPIVIEQFERKKQGVAQLNLSLKDINEISIPLPKKEKQIEFAELFDKVRGVISKRNMELSALDDLVKARFVELFGKIDKKIAVSSLCDVSGGYSFKSGDISADGSVRILQIGNVYLDDVNWETTNYLPDGFDDTYSRFLLNEGDIVVALTRPIIQSLGNVKACIVKESDTPCLLNQRVGRIVPKQNADVTLEFIYGCLMTDDFTRYVESCCIGCSQPNISTKDIEKYMIPDVSYDEQMDYVRFKKQVDKSKFAVQKSLEESQLLFDSLMQEYFG